MFTHVLKISKAKSSSMHCPSLIATASLHGNGEVLDLLKEELEQKMIDKEIAKTTTESKYDRM